MSDETRLRDLLPGPAQARYDQIERNQRASNTMTTTGPRDTGATDAREIIRSAVSAGYHDTRTGENMIDGIANAVLNTLFARNLRIIPGDGSRIAGPGVVAAVSRVERNLRTYLELCPGLIDDLDGTAADLATVRAFAAGVDGE